MFKDFQSDPLVKKILVLNNKYGNSLKFHKKCSTVIKEFSNPEFITNVFKQYISNKNFLNKKWKSYEIPHLVIYENEDISIVYNIFNPTANEGSEIASHLIHHHQSFILSSYIMAGPGYHTIEFEKEIKYLTENNCYILKPTKSFLHKKGKVNILEENIPHLIFNVPETTISIALWTEKKEEKSEKNNYSLTDDRLSYFKKNHLYFGLSENDFLHEITSNIDYEDESEIHIQTICYFFQEFANNNRPYLLDVNSNPDIPEKWRYWLNMLYSDTKINPPHIKNNLNTLGNKMEIEDFNY